MRKQLKMACIILCASTLLCACNSREAFETEKDAGQGSSTSADTHGELTGNSSEKTNIDSRTPEPTEKPFSEITLWDDEYCTLILASDLLSMGDGLGIYEFKMKITNKTNGNLSFSLSSPHINDVRRAEYSLDSISRRFSPQITDEITCTLAAPGNTPGMIDKLDCYVNIAYDNGEVGVYNEHVIVLDDVITIYTNGSTETDKYMAGNQDVLSLDGESVKIIVTDCTTINSINEVSMYLENTSDDTLTLYFGACTVTSDQQNTPYWLGSEGKYYLDWNSSTILLGPGCGCYASATLSKILIDQYAKDISEQVAVSFPISVLEDNRIPNYDLKSKEEIMVSLNREEFNR